MRFCRNSVRGLVPTARPERGMIPARYADLPASMAFANAPAMAGGFCAAASALLTSTPEQPISMAAAASDGDLKPASTITGTELSLMIILKRLAVSNPCPLPIAEPRGITDAQPASSSRFASTGSAGMYGITMNPSFTSIFAAS